MRILALDTALHACSVCVYDTQTARVLAHESVAMERGHAEALMPMAERVSQATGGFGSVDRIVATIGPGSFTGIRVGLAGAHGLMLATGASLVGVSTLDALAATRFQANSADAVIFATIDARHGSFYLGAYASNGIALAAPWFGKPDSIAAFIYPGRPVHLIGSGARALVEAAQTHGGRILSCRHASAPAIIDVARLGAQADAQVPARPLYLKAPDVTLPKAAS